VLDVQEKKGVEYGVRDGEWSFDSLREYVGPQRRTHDLSPQQLGLSPSGVSPSSIDRHGMATRVKVAVVESFTILDWLNSSDSDKRQKGWGFNLAMRLQVCYSRKVQGELEDEHVLRDKEVKRKQPPQMANKGQD